MSVKIYIRDNTIGTVHEYGTNPHDALILQEDGSLHYENLQNCTGTMYPEEGYTAIAKAEADKKVAIANAEAKAEATRIAAKAEAEANELLTNSLNDNIIKLKFYEKWNGVLPTVMGEGTVITDVGGN